MHDWKVTMAWHDNDKNRKAFGDMAEKRFANQFRCSCGGQFDFIGDKGPGYPDFTCDNCGRLVEVKFSPQAEQTGNISISAIPWDGYPDDLLVVTFINGRLIGEEKQNIHIQEPVAREPTHHKLGNYKNTRFYLISWMQFRESEELGLVSL
jgi:hypothetical protein